MSQLLNGRYQLIQILGTNTLGHTYLVEDTQASESPRRVIRHMQLPSKNPRTLKFVITVLKKKAESLGKLSSYNRAPKILASFEEDNNFYLVEEFIEGRSLEEEIQPGQMLSPHEVITLVEEILDILVTVHAWGFVHRCIKPSSLIRRGSDQQLVLTGFGIFKEIGAQVAQSQGIPPEQYFNGSSAYISPEQFNKQVHFNTDLYAVGVIGIQALTGLSAPEIASVLRNRIGESLRSWKTLPAAQGNSELVAILEKLVHPDSQQRYQQSTDALDDLQRLKVRKPVTKLPPPPTVIPVTPLKPKRRSPRWLGYALAGGFVVGLGLVLWQSHLPQAGVAHYFVQRARQQTQDALEEDAIATYTRAIQINPTSTAFFERGMLYLRQERQQEALEDLTQAIQRNPTFADAYYQRGNIRFNLGDYQSAAADYTEALKLNPNFTEVYVNRGTVRAEIGDEQGALEDYSQAIQLDPNLSAAYLNRCLSRSNLEDHRGAIADCTQAIALQPNSVLAYQNRGLVRRRLGDFSGAIEDFNIAIRLDPTDPDPYYNRGLARSELGDQAGAIADFTSAIQQDPQHVFAYYDRALVRAEMNDIEGAIADLRQSATLCLDSGRMGCYEDAQYQINLLTQPQPVSAPDPVNDPLP